MEENGSSDFDLAGMILQCRKDVSRIESELAERKADLSAMERVKRIGERKNITGGKEQSERASVQERARYLAERMAAAGISNITPKEALGLIGDAPFFNGLAYKSKHVYVTRALQHKPVFRLGATRGVYYLVGEPAEPAAATAPDISLMLNPPPANGS